MFQSLFSRFQTQKAIDPIGVLPSQAVLPRTQAKTVHLYELSASKKRAYWIRWLGGLSLVCAATPVSAFGGLPPDFAWYAMGLSLVVFFFVMLTIGSDK